ncbi:MAG: transposase [Oscillospiraceae bacterium]|nr:transposase [Oscillospiraceae bacterium]
MKNRYDKQFKEEAIRLSDEVGVNKAAHQLELSYNTLIDWRRKRKQHSNIKIMPMHYPPVTSYHYHSDLLSIILDHKESEGWLMNNYIQLYAMPPSDKNNFFRIDYYFPYSVWKSCPLIYYQRVNDKFIKDKWDSIIDFLIYCINKDCYAYIDYDRYFIPCMNAYNSYHVNHDMFIYGYDSDKRQFHVAEYSNDNKYTYFTINFEDLKLGYESANKEHNHNNIVNGIEIISYYNRYGDLPISIDYIIQGIKDYLNSTSTNSIINPHGRWEFVRYSSVYGVEVYKNIYYYLETFLAQNPDKTDTHPLHVCHEHKQIMLMRIKRLAQMGYIRYPQYIYTNYKKAVKYALLAKNLHTKYIITKDSKLIERIVESTKKAEILDRCVLNFLIKNINTRYDLQPVIIDEDLEDCPFEFEATVKKESCVFLRNSDILTDDSLLWTSNNNDVCTLDVESTKTETLLYHRKPGTAVLQAVNEKGDIVMVCKCTCIDSGFKTNFTTSTAYEGQWKETNHGLKGNGDHEFVLFDNVGNDFVYETQITVLSKRGAPGIVFKSSRYLEDFYCICLDADSGYAILWEPNNVIAREHLGIQPSITYHVKVLSKGKEVSFYMDGNLIFKHENSKIREGYFGLMATGKSIFQKTGIYSIMDNNDDITYGTKIIRLPSHTETPGFCGHVGNGVHFFHSHESKTISTKGVNDIGFD